MDLVLCPREIYISMYVSGPTRKFTRGCDNYLFRYENGFGEFSYDGYSIFFLDSIISGVYFNIRYIIEFLSRLG
jgi:hypothetical protein